MGQLRMITFHSIDLRYINEPCFAEMSGNGCRALSARSEHCRSQKCPFYKPKGCKDWIRIEDKSGINVVPYEEYLRYRRGKK